MAKPTPRERKKAVPKKAAPKKTNARPKRESPRAGLSELVAFAARHQSSFDEAQAELVARHGIGGGGSWGYDQTTMQLRFTPPAGTKPEVVARASLLGSWSNESWLWAWANDSILEPVARASLQVKEAGEGLALSELTAATFFASPDVVERLAVASFGILGARGCYFPTTATGRLVFVIHSIV